jgi:uncharacterized protein YbgA (DUF1722 family)/uncharacterized protein YbbK (DUF523 family)
MARRPSEAAPAARVASRPDGSTDAVGPPWGDEVPLRIGVSSCLLGSPVRWDGGHKRDAFLVDQLGPFVEWVPVCPELELGMGVPRETIRLVVRDGGRRLVAERSGSDWTERMEVFARRRLRELDRLGLCGYVLKRGSPSCGLERVPLCNAAGAPERRGRGLFAEALLAHAEALPVEEEGRLADASLRENWIERVFAYRRLRSLFARRWTRGDLVTFHTAHELQLLSHSPRLQAGLGRLVAAAKEIPRATLRERYERAFMETLCPLATPRRHVDVLHHVLGHFRGRLDAADRRELRELIEDYGRGLVPLVVPITLIRHHVARLAIGSLARQVYLAPHPKELMLRNRV